MQITLEMVRHELDSLRAVGLDIFEISRRLDLKQVQGSPRTVEKWYAASTTCRTVEYRALRDLARELSADSGISL